jgi:cytosine/adenosine deaminase-related metal-dependent hydrolase
MKYISAQYVLTNNGDPLKRAVIITEDDGTIISIEETKGALREKHTTEFYNGILIPGFINCHCHLLEVFSPGPAKAFSRMDEITRSGNLILVHNTFTDLATLRKIRERERLFWCLCPNSSMFTEKNIPVVKMLLEEDCTIVIGTDSQASNNDLSILEELKTLQLHFPDLTLTDLVSWATINGAKALGEETLFGKIEPGKKPGLLLLQDVDLFNMKLLPESFVTRLI